MASLQVLLAVEHVVPGRRERVLEVGHEHAGAGVERVDHHLALDRAGDLAATVLEVGGRRRHLPFRLAHFLRRGQEVGGFAGVDPLLAGRSGFEPAAALGVESAMEIGDEGERLRRQDVASGGWNGPLDLDRHRTLSFTWIRVLPRESKSNARGEE